MKNFLKKLIVEEQGQDVIEYALLAAGDFDRRDSDGAGDRHRRQRLSTRGFRQRSAKIV